MTSSLNTWIKNALSKIGPYPYNPYLIFFLIFSLMSSRFSPLVLEEIPGLERFKAVFLIFLLAALPALVFSAYAYIIGKYRFWSGKSLFFYILEVAFGVSLQFIFYLSFIPIFENQFGYDIPPVLTASPNMFIVSLIFALFALYVMHRAERSIITRLNEANNLVAQLKTDRQDLVNQGEEFRLKTAQFLHDRLQSDLFLSGMKLKSIVGTSTTEGNEILERVITRLENSRGKDLKNLIEVLSPNFDSVGLEGAFEALVLQFESEIKITIDIDDASEKLDHHQMLGLYRIAEQALLNTLAHGPISQVKVEVSTSTTGVAKISIADDGPGTELNKIKPGVGSAIIDSWVELLNGTKSIKTAPGLGYQLVVSLEQK